MQDTCEPWKVAQQSCAGTVAVNKRGGTARVQVDTGHPGASQQHVSIAEQGICFAPGKLCQDGYSCLIFIDAAQIELCQGAGGAGAAEIRGDKSIRQ